MARANLVVRVLLILATFQVTGVVHLVSDLLGDPSTVECTSACDDDVNGRCPPVCGDCVCSHAARSMLPAVSPIGIAGALHPSGTMSAALNGPPEDPLGRNIFQPPRA